MKSFKFILAALVLSVAVVSCAKVEKILVKKEGKWNVTNTVTRVYTNSVLDTTITDANPQESYIFLEDGTGTLTDIDTSYAFTWTVNDDESEINLCFDFFGLQICTKNTIVNSEKNLQEWSYTDFVTGDTDWSEGEGTLERAE